MQRLDVHVVGPLRIRPEIVRLKDWGHIYECPACRWIGALRHLGGSFVPLDHWFWPARRLLVSIDAWWELGLQDGPLSAGGHQIVGPTAGALAIKALLDDGTFVQFDLRTCPLCGGVLRCDSPDRTDKRPRPSMVEAPKWKAAIGYDEEQRTIVTYEASQAER